MMMTMIFSPTYATTLTLWLVLTVTLVQLCHAGSGDSDAIVNRCRTDCTDSLPSTQTGDVHCNETCRLNQCHAGCQLWQDAAASNCEEVCNGTFERQVTPIKHLHCNVGCRLAADLYIHSVLDILGQKPPPPVLVAETQTNVSVSIRWTGPLVPLSMNVSYLVQWKYDVLSDGWEYYRPKDPIIGATRIQRINGLQPYTKYKFRVAWIVLSKYDIIMSEESVCISTLAYGAPSTAPIVTSVAAVDASHISVTWEPPQFPNGPILSYVVHLYQQPNGFTLIKDIPEPNAIDHFFMFNNLGDNTTYYVAVSCRNGVGEGPKAVRNVTTPFGGSLGNESGKAYLVIGTHLKVVKQGLEILDEPAILYEPNEQHVHIRGMAIHMRHNVFFVSDSEGHINRVPIDRGGVVVSTINQRSVESRERRYSILSVDWLNDKLYMVETKQPAISRCDLDGNNYELLVTGMRRPPCDLKVDPYDGYLYWIALDSTRGNGLHRLDLESFGDRGVLTEAEAELIVRGDGSLTTLTIDHRNYRILLPNNTENTVYSTSLSGSELTDVRRNTQQPKFQGTRSMVIYNDLLYWTTGDEVYGEEHLEERYYHNSILVVEAKKPFFALEVVHAEAQPTPVPINSVQKVQTLFHETMAEVAWLKPKPLGGMGSGAWQLWTYEISVKELNDSDDNGVIMRSNITDFTCTIEGLQPSTKYAVLVRACSEDGKGPWSETFVGKTLKNATKQGFPYILWSSFGLLKSDIIGNDVQSLIEPSALQNSQVIDMCWYKDRFFLATNGSQVFVYNVNNRSVAPLSNVTSAVSISVDWLGRKIYWSNPKQQVISRANLDGTFVEPLLILTVAKELNIDSIHGRIYWTTSHSVECARLNGDEPRKYYQTGFFSGKRVMGLTLDNDRQRVIWMVWSFDGAKLYNAKMASYYPVAREELTASIVTESLGSFPEDALQGPIRYFNDRLLWLRDPNEAIVSDLSGRNTAHMHGLGLENLRSLIVVDPTLQPYPDGVEATFHVIPSAVNESTIKVNGVWKDFNVTWSKVMNVNHGQVFYEIGIDDGLNQPGSKVVTVSEYPSYIYPHFHPLPPYSSLTLSIRAFTYWGSSNRIITTIHSPISVPSEPLRPRVYIIFDDRQQQIRDRISFDDVVARAEFRWSEPKRPNGIILGYIVTVWNGGRDPIWEEDIVAPLKLNYTTRPLTHNCSYFFRVRAYTEVGEGPQSELVQAQSSQRNPVPKLLLVRTHSIGMIDVDDDRVHSITSGSIRPSDATYLWHDGTVFWLDQNLGALMRSSMKNRTNRTKMHNLVKKSNSLTVDWIGRTIYWSEVEEANENSSIWAINIDRNEITKVLSTSTKIGSIQVEPFTSTLLWTSIGWDGVATLMRSNTDSTNTQPFFRLENVSSRVIRDLRSNCNCSRDVTTISTVAIDHSNSVKKEPSTVIFVDERQNLLWMSDFSGCNCQLLLNATDHRNDYGFPPTSLTSDHGHVYWLKADLGRIFIMTKHSHTKNDANAITQIASIKAEDSNRLLDIVALGSHLQLYPDFECLIPRPYDKAPIVTNYTDTTITLQVDVMPPLAECGSSTSRATIQYTFYYWTTDDSQDPCTNKSNGCLVLNTYERTNIVRGLKPFVNYTFRVAVSNFYAKETIGLSPVVTQRTAEGVPSQPTNVTVVVISPHDLQVSWNPSRHISPGPSVHYAVYWRRALSTIDSGSVTSSSKEDKDAYTNRRFVSGLEPRKQYVLWVRAHTKYGVGFNDSDEVTVTTYDIPNDLRLENATSDSIIVSWTSPADPVIVRHAVKYKKVYEELTNESRSPEFKKTEPNKNYSFHVHGLKPKSQYAFQLQLEYRSSPENVTYEWPRDRRFVFETLGDCPGPPGRPEVMSFQRDEYKVLWTPSELRGGDQLEYNLESQLNDDSTGNIGWRTVYNGTEPKWTVTGHGPVYDQRVFRVRARNEYGFSNYSENSLRFTYSQASVQGYGASNEQLAIVLGVSVPVLFLLLACFAYFMCKGYQRREKDKKILQEIVSNMQNPNLELATLRDLPQNHNFVHENNAMYALSVSGDVDLAGLPHVSSTQIVLIKFLGCGAFGEVFEGIAHTLPGETDTDIRVAVKTLRKGATDHEKTEFLKEAQLMSNFKHDHILSLLGVCLDNDPNFLILELMDGGDLLTYLRNNRPTSYASSSLTIQDLISICVDVAKGCTHLEDMHFIHRDLAARNCLVSSHDCSRRIVKIGDFGLARDIYKNDYYRKEGEGLLPVRWMSPESLIDGVFTSQSDVWAFGVLLWEVMTLGQQPYPARTNVEVLHYVRGGGRLDKPDNCPDDLHQLMLKCWCYGTADRPTFKYCLQQLQELKRKSEQTPITANNNNSVHNQNYIGRDRANGVDNLAYTCDDSMATSDSGVMTSLRRSSDRGTRLSEADTASIDDAMSERRLDIGRLTSESDTDDLTKLLERQQPPTESHRYLELLYDADDDDVVVDSDSVYEIPLSASGVRRNKNVASDDTSRPRTLSDGLQGNSDGRSIPSLFTGRAGDTDDAKQFAAATTNFGQTSRQRGASQPLLLSWADDAILLQRSRSSLGHIPSITRKDKDFSLRAVGDFHVTSAPLIDSNRHALFRCPRPWRDASSISLGTGTDTNSDGQTTSSSSSNSHEGRLTETPSHLSGVSGLSALSGLSSSTSTSGIDMDYVPSSTWC